MAGGDWAGGSDGEPSESEDEPDSASLPQSDSASECEDEAASSSAPTDRTTNTTDGPGGGGADERPRAYVLRSLFVGRPSTVWFGYAPFLEKERIEGQGARPPTRPR